jgi:S1-C subfamily serine protease
MSDLTVPKGWMGVTVNSAAGGALVQFVMPTGPAGRAGIAPNDVIIAIDGRPISDQAGFHSAISATTAGQTVTVALLRAGQSYRVAVKLRKNPFRGR